MDFARVWEPYLYLYGVGGAIFIISMLVVLRSGATRIGPAKDRRWVWVLLGGFLWFSCLHGGTTLAALGSEAPVAPEGVGGEASHPSSALFLGVILGYVAVVLGFGAWFSRFNRTTSDFFFGGRRFSWWLITMSIVATGVGSHSFLKYSAKGFQHGFSSSMTYLNDWFFMPLFLFGWLPIIYFSRVRSIPEYFERRFNKPARRLATLALLVYMLGYIAIGFLTMAKTLEPVFELYLGWDVGVNTIIWAVAIVSGVYITFGGQTAVIFTDLLQGFILLFAGFLLLALGLNWLGGFDLFWNALSPQAKLPLGGLNHPQDYHTVGIFWQDGVAGSIGFLFLNQGLLMRFMACRSVNEGRKAAAFNTLMLLPLSALVVSGAGWLGKAIATARPDLLPMETAPDEVFTRVAALVSSPIVFSFLIAAVVAALMSTVDTLINAVAAIFVNDIYRPIVGQKADRHFLKVAMIVSACATVVGVMGTYVFRGFDTLFEAHAKFHGTVTPPLVAAVFLGAFWRRFTPDAAVATFVGGVALILAGQAFPEVFIKPLSHGVDMDPEHPWKYMGALWNLVACFGVGVVVTYFTKPRPFEEIEGLTIHSLDAARRGFKRGVPNDRPGQAHHGPWKEDESLQQGEVSLTPSALSVLQAEVGDLVYLSDSRWWLGGLRSAHGRIAHTHFDEECVRIARDLHQSGHFLKRIPMVIHKEM